MTALTYWLWLSTLPGVGSQMKLALLEHFGGDPERIYFGEEGEYLLVEGMTRAIAGALKQKSLDTANRVLGDCDKLGLRIITIQDLDYPDRLRNIYDPPILLYVQGRMPQFDGEVAVAMSNEAITVVATHFTSPDSGLSTRCSRMKLRCEIFTQAVATASFSLM